MVTFYVVSNWLWVPSHKPTHLLPWKNPVRPFPWEGVVTVLTLTMLQYFLSYCQGVFYF